MRFEQSVNELKKIRTQSALSQLGHLTTERKLLSHHREENYQEILHSHFSFQTTIPNPATSPYIPPSPISNPNPRHRVTIHLLLPNHDLQSLPFHLSYSNWHSPSGGFFDASGSVLENITLFGVCGQDEEFRDCFPRFWEAALAIAREEDSEGGVSIWAPKGTGWKGVAACELQF